MFLLIANILSVVFLGFWVIPPVLAFVRRYEAKYYEIQCRILSDQEEQGSEDNETD